MCSLDVEKNFHQLAEIEITEVCIPNLDVPVPLAGNFLAFLFLSRHGELLESCI